MFSNIISTLALLQLLNAAPILLTRYHVAAPTTEIKTVTTGTTTVWLPPVGIYISDGQTSTSTITDAQWNTYPVTFTSIINKDQAAQHNKPLKLNNNLPLLLPVRPVRLSQLLLKPNNNNNNQQPPNKPSLLRPNNNRNNQLLPNNNNNNNNLLQPNKLNQPLHQLNKLNQPLHQLNKLHSQLNKVNNKDNLPQLNKLLKQLNKVNKLLNKTILPHNHLPLQL